MFGFWKTISFTYSMNQFYESCCACFSYRSICSSINWATWEKAMVSIITFLLPFLLLVSLATSQSGKKCKCDWFSSNCKISVEAEANMACKCTATWILGMFPDKCFGEDVPCANPGHRYCKNPDKSYLSCLQGQGYCRGYQHQTTASEQGCECDYGKPNGIFNPGGCSIVNRSPENHACYCHYTFLTCYGTVELCKDPNSHKCSFPDTSLQSCLQGGGDCGGYAKY